MNFLSNRLRFFDSSDFRLAIQRQQELSEPIDLSVGIPEELTASHIKSAGIKAIKQNKTTYTPSNGIKELRQAIANKLGIENSIDCDENSVTIVPGLTTGQLLVYLAVLDPGDEVIVLDPYYPPYPHLASMIGAHVVKVSTLPTFQPNLAAIEASITDRTKIIVINSPNNPTGAVYGKETLEKIATIAGKNNLLVLSDEIYEHFSYGQKHFSIGSIHPDTITLNGFSKGYAMTGWRLGYLAGPRPIIEAINELQQYVVFASSSLAQHAALAAINGKASSKMVKKYRNKRDYVIDELTNMGYEINGAQGAYYIFLRTPNKMLDVEFTEIAAENNVILVPGRAFSSLYGFVRLSYGADMGTLKRGMKALRELNSLQI